MLKICIDPGHGGRDPGAIGPTGLREKEVTLAIAKLVEKLLQPVGAVRLTRDKDVALGPEQRSDLNERIRISNQFEADCFVSIHADSCNNPSAHGFSVYTTQGKTQADKLANCLIASLKAHLSLTLRADMSDGDADKEAGFAVLRGTIAPACLVELAFISNPAEEALLRSLIFQMKAALAIAEGIAAFFGVQVHLQPDSQQVSEVADSAESVAIKVGGLLIHGQLINGMTWVPVRPLAEALGRKVDWDESERTVTVK